ncbi:MAG: hypothetical protein LKK00_08405 [Intestinimonas sp.]|nr:hypothetical protein [Intestinimonas sp.]
MGGRRNIITAVIGAFVIALTFVLYFLIVRNPEIMDWIGLIFILIAEISLFGGLIATDIKARQSTGVMLRSGAYSVLIVYTAVAVILSILFLSVPGLRDDIRLFIAVQIVIIAVTAIILLLIIAGSRAVANSNKAAEQSVSSMYGLMNKVMAMKDDSKNLQYSDSLGKIYEAIKYSDLSSATAQDDALSDKIIKLESILSSDIDDKTEKVTQIINDILLLVKQKTADLKARKSGVI